MPVTTRKVDGGYKNFTPNTGAHSKKPMTLKDAKAQAAILRAAEHNPNWKPTGKKKKKKKKTKS